MSDPRILICAPALDTEEAVEGLECLREVSLPNTVKIVATTGKFDTGGDVQRLNLDVGYPSDQPHLMTLAAWAGLSMRTDPRFRDGFDTHCLREVLKRHGGCDYAILFRSGGVSDWSRPTAERPFTLFNEGAEGTTSANLVCDLAVPEGRVFVDALSEFYFRGAAYALEPYSFGRAVDATWQAIDMIRTISGPPTPGAAPWSASNDRDSDGVAPVDILTPAL